MISCPLEFEIEYKPEQEKLLVTDYNASDSTDKPLRMGFNPVRTIKDVLTVMETWLTLKEENACNRENG